MALLYKQHGGAWIQDDWLEFRVPWPFAVLEIYDDKIVLRSLTSLYRRTITIPLDHIDSVTKEFLIPVITWGIHINYHANRPSNIDFWYWYGTKPLDYLRRLGVPIR